MYISKYFNYCRVNSLLGYLVRLIASKIFLSRSFVFVYFFKIKILYKISISSIVFLSLLILSIDMIYSQLSRLVKSIYLLRSRIIIKYALLKPAQNLVLSIFHTYLSIILLLKQISLYFSK